MSQKSLAGLSTQERSSISQFSALEKTTVSVDDLMALHPRKRATANQILSRLAHKGWLQRVKRGTYTLVPLSSTTATPVIENAWLLAIDLFKPAFISGWSAAEHWGLTEQIFNSVSVCTSTPQRSSKKSVGGLKFRTKSISKDHFFGIKTVWFGSKKVHVADPSRMLIDILNLPRFGGGGRHMVDIVKAYWHSEHRDEALLFNHAMAF